MPGPTGNVGPLAMGLGCEPGRQPAPMMGTVVVSGTLAFAGADYLVLRIPAWNCRDILIPYDAIGTVIPGGPTL